MWSLPHAHRLGSVHPWLHGQFGVHQRTWSKDLTDWESKGVNRKVQGWHARNVGWLLKGSKMERALINGEQRTARYFWSGESNGHKTHDGRRAGIENVPEEGRCVELHNWQW